MKWSPVRRYLRTYKIYRRQSTSVTYGFASAVAPREQVDESEILQSLEMLGQDTEDVSCVYCGNPAQIWDHLFPIVKAGRQFGPGHRIRNLVPCCGRCSGSKGNKDFETWLPHSFENWKDTLEKLRAYAGGVAEDPPLPPEIEAETEAELDKYWAIRDRVFDLLREADEIAARIQARRGNSGGSQKKISWGQNGKKFACLV
jgi:hypothetical protein